MACRSVSDSASARPTRLVDVQWVVELTVDRRPSSKDRCCSRRRRGLVADESLDKTTNFALDLRRRIIRDRVSGPATVFVAMRCRVPTTRRRKCGVRGGHNSLALIARL